MVLASNLGFPRIGANRELKRAVEAYWAGKSSEEELLDTAKTIRQANWLMQQEAGLDHIPSNDFSLYDLMLDTTAMVGAVPERFGFDGQTVDLGTYFAMARGVSRGGSLHDGVAAMEMTKWFDTNYHYMVPEFTKNQAFRLASSKPVDQFLEAKALGVHTRPVLVGPVTYLALGKMKDKEGDPLDLLPAILPVYEEVLKRLAEAGADWVQVDEPILALDCDDITLDALKEAYGRLAQVDERLHILLATYFGGLDGNTDKVMALPVSAVHVDLVRAPGQLEGILAALPEGKMLSLGVVDGRNIWRADLDAKLEVIGKAVDAVGEERLLVGPSCSMLHCPVDLDSETTLDADIRSWLAFAKQKVSEIAALAKAVNNGEEAAADALAASREAAESRRTSPRIHKDAVKSRLAAVTPEMAKRQSPYPARRPQQAARLGLPAFPTTTIGSFPQTREVRKARAEFRRGERTAEEYEAFLKEQTAEAVRFQESVGLDVLVHGEFERNDMVEYFGEQLDGFAFTRNGWVQSYGSRCVKPPIIYGDVSRPAPMTVDWFSYAQSLTGRPMKGMLTGPVTILQWSFVRDDQPRSETCHEIALAIRDEVCDLEAAGSLAIQIDEPALREGLPLRRSEWASYLDWAVESFRLSTCGVRDDTQIHTHMCYSEFNDIIDSIAALDADVISIEASRSRMELLDAFVDFKYPNEIGPGVYDIHSPRVPTQEEMEDLLRKAAEVINAEQLWVNPDCGLKTRGWPEVKPALEAMVRAAETLREA